jgi:hypothetical protein
MKETMNWMVVLNRLMNDRVIVDWGRRAGRKACRREDWSMRIFFYLLVKINFIISVLYFTHRGLSEIHGTLD